MVSIVSCLSGTALTGRTATKTLVGILQLIVLVSLTTKQTDAETAAACYGTAFEHPPKCKRDRTVNVLRVTVGSDKPCVPGYCCPYGPRCEVSAEEVEPAFYQSVMATCHGQQHCDGLQAPSRWTLVTEHCEDPGDSSDRLTGVYAKYVKIEYNCKRVSSTSLPSPSWTTTTPDEDPTRGMTTWDDFQTLVMGSRVSDPVTPYDVTTDSGEASGSGHASDQVGVAVGVTVAVLVIGVITAVLVICVLRRRKEKSPHCHDNAASEVVIPSASPRTTAGSTSDPPPLDPTASSGNPHSSSHRAAQDTDYDVVNSPYVNQEVANSPYVNQEVANSPCVNQEVVKSPYVNHEVVNSPHAKVKGQTAQDFGLDLRLVDNTMYDAMTGPQN